MKRCLIRELNMLEGRAKILASVSDAARSAILASAADFPAHPVDILEWRIDCFEEAGSVTAVTEMLAALREAAGEMPILATFRTAREGGLAEITSSDYVKLLAAVIKSGNAAAVDVELFMEAEVVESLVELAHSSGVAVVMSNHDFNETPELSELERRLARMGELGADIAKIAVMPRCEADVETLLAATRSVKEGHPDLPVLTISMGELGMRSRTDGWRYGSCATFGCIGKPSAPGQIEVEELIKYL